jgi:hypothetical protein
MQAPMVRWTAKEIRAKGLTYYTQRDLRNMSVVRQTTARTKTGEYRQGRYGERYIDTAGFDQKKIASVLYALSNSKTPRQVQLVYQHEGNVGSTRTDEGFSTVQVNESRLRDKAYKEYTSGTPGTDYSEIYTPDEITTIIYAPFKRTHYR